MCDGCGARFGGCGGEVGEDFVVGEDSGLSLDDLSGKMVSVRK